MDTKLTDLEGSRKQLESSLTYDELKPHFEKALFEFSKKAVEPGFRKGKVPMNIIRKKYGESIEYGSLEDIAGDIFSDYLGSEGESLRIVGRPVITDIDYKPKESLNIRIEFEVLPEIKDIVYKGLDLEKTKYELDDSLVDDEIKYHRFRKATHEIDGQALDDQYLITVDLQNLDDAGNILLGESQKGMTVYLGNEQIYPEFREAFRGIRENETRIVDSKNADGNPKKVRVTCTKVEKIVPPELTPEFFREVTGKEDINTEEEFRSEIRSELQKIYDGIAERKFRNDVMEELVRMNDVSAPEALVDSVLTDVINEYKSQFQGKKVPDNFDEAAFRKERRPDAILSAKWMLIRDKLVELETLAVSDDDYMRLAEKEAGRYGIPAEKILEILKKDENISGKLLTDKVIEIVERNANVKEKVEKKSAETEAKAS
ncbi:MAG: trigger factor [Ignavibacteria bacterium]|nr:trigger factor [Ignavibacteria bacterium]